MNWIVYLIIHTLIVLGVIIFFGRHERKQNKCPYCGKDRQKECDCEV